MNPSTGSPPRSPTAASPQPAPVHRPTTSPWSLVKRAVLGLLGSALGVMSVIMLLARTSPGISRGITVPQLSGYIGLFLSITLILRVILEILRPHRH
jgi:hypothetical protein